MKSTNSHFFRMTEIGVQKMQAFFHFVDYYDKNGIFRMVSKLLKTNLQSTG